MTTTTTRETKLTKAFVTLADTLVSDFDLVDLLQVLVETCTDVLETSAAGLMLRSPSGQLQVVASTTEDAEVVELIQLAVSSGPCLQCVETGKPVSVPDIEATGGRWPEFTRAALERGFRSVQATPMRLRDEVIGTMNLFCETVGPLGDEDVDAAQALADVATIAVLTERAAREKSVVNAQLQGALDSRVAIEQAKGVLAQSTGASMEDAFALLRAYARAHDAPLRAVASDLVARRLHPSALLAGPPVRQAPQRAR